MTRMDRIALGLLKPVNPYGSLILGLLTFAWGIWIAIPAWAVFDSAPLFSRINQIAPEWAVGIFAVAVGIALMISVVKGSFKCLSAVLVACAWYWTITSGLMWWGDWRNTGGLTYSFIAIYSIYLHLNIKMNYVKK